MNQNSYLNWLIKLIWGKLIESITDRKYYPGQSGGLSIRL